MNEMLSRAIPLGITALIVENLVIVRGIGITTVTRNIEKSVSSVMFALVIAVQSAVSSIACHYALMPLRDKPYRIYVQSAAAALTTALVYIITYIILAAALPKVFARLSSIMPVAVFNVVTLGIILLTVYERLTVPQIIVFCVGSAAGYLLGSFFIREGMARLSGVRVPKYAKGLPILLLYMGLLSLAFYGLIGHTLPY